MDFKHTANAPAKPCLNIDPPEEATTYQRKDCRSKGSLPAVQDRLHETCGPRPVGPGEAVLTGLFGKRPVIRQQASVGVGLFSGGGGAR
jgi:hypothetical protein